MCSRLQSVTAPLLLGTGPRPLLSALGGAGGVHSTKTCRRHLVVFCELGSGPGPALSAITEKERAAQNGAQCNVTSLKRTYLVLTMAGAHRSCSVPGGEATFGAMCMCIYGQQGHCF